MTEWQVARRTSSEARPVTQKVIVSPWCALTKWDAVAKRASLGMPKPNACPRRSGNSEKPAYAKPIVAGISPGGF
ncbi:nuclear mRNA splicing factor [Aspergillus luchuensis]|uniref:Nuclear mRNA splicing factor n=1 Tax=Aspergillus kawachii TaxID=1069201 RepID=A0A146FVJ6_ASPKA|nr:nuclear mRNA splicing factor [Aspergillus luchuensis]